MFFDIVFQHLTKLDLKDVIDLELAKVRERLRDRGYELDLTDDAKEFIIRKGANLDYGARPLRRAIENYVEDPLAEELLRGEFQGKDKIIVAAVKNDEDKVKHLSFEGVEVEKPPEPETEPEPVGAVAEDGDSDEPAEASDAE